MSLVDEILEWPSFTGVQLDFLQKNTSFGTSILKGVKHAGRILLLALTVGSSTQTVDNS